MTIIRVSATLSINDNDKQIIATMKKLGVWHRMKEFSIIGKGDKTMMHDNYIFHWHSTAGDSGYTAYHSTDKIELLTLFAKIKQKLGGDVSLEPVGTVH